MAGEVPPTIIPTNLGCGEDCGIGRKLSLTLQDEKLFPEGDELPQVIAAEVQEILQNEPCTHIATAECKLADYLLQNAIGLRIITETKK